MNSYDIIILGGGPAGFTAANRAASKGLNTAIFECANLGGVCLNEGCIPSKSFIHSSKIYNESTREFDNKKNEKYNFLEWIKDKNLVVDQLKNGVRGSLRKNKVKINFSKGTISSYQNGISTIKDADGNEYITKHLIIAVGSKIFVPPIDGLSDSLNSEFVLTTNNIFDCADSFSSLVIIGGGVIGIELAYCFSKCGVKVYIIEASNKIGASMDSDAMHITEECLINYGVEIYKNSLVTKIRNGYATISKDGYAHQIQCDKILLCAGRQPNLDGYGLEIVAPLIDKGSIITNDKMETSRKGVYAIGDINGKSMLAHSAYREAEVCVNNIIGERDSIDYNVVPNVLYGTPEVASVGLSENDIKLEGGGFIKKIPMLFSGRAVAEHSAKYGFCKLLFDSNEVLRGGVMVGEYASEIITTLEIMITGKYTLSEMQKIIYPHPSVCEIIREAIYAKSETI